MPVADERPNRRTQDPFSEGEQASDRMRLALASAEVGVWDWNVKTNRVDWSGEVEPIFGLGPGEFARTFEAYVSMIHPEDRTRVLEVIEATVEGGSDDYAMEHRLRQEPGKPARWIFARGRVYRDNQGRALHMTGTVIDATPRKRAEESLRRAEELFRDIVDDQEEMIVRWLPDGTRTFVNRAYCRAFGGEAADFIGTSFLPLVAEPDRQAVLDKVAALTPSAPVATHTHQSILPGGEVGWQEWTDRGRFDESGRLIELQSVGRDVTERKRAEQSLAASELLLRLFIRHTPAAVAMFDTEVRYLQWSERWQSDYQLQGQDLAGRSHYEIFPEIGSEWKAIHQRALGGSVESADEDLFIRADGTKEWLQWEVRPWFRTDGSIGGIIMFTQVITRRKEMEEALKQSEESLRQAQKFEAIGQLAGGIAHDFNNLLAAILLQAHSNMRTPGLDEKNREGLGQIVEAAERGANLTRQLLQFSRKQVMQCTWLDLNKVTSDLSKMLQRVMRADVEMRLDLFSRPLPVFADAVMIDQILMNLALNARDAMPNGGRLLIELSEIQLTSDDLAAFSGTEPGVFACLSVTDSGQGIDPENLDRIFEPFFTTKEAGRGTGLGLATVFGIVRQHKGALFVDSSLGKGTTFRIAFPTNAQATVGSTKLPAPESGSAQQARGEPILVVEDDTAVRDSLRGLLLQEGYQVFAVADAGEALLAWERIGSDVRLLITDMVIPGGLSGRDLAQRFQSLSPNLKVILTSGYSPDVFGQALDLDERQVFMPKPVRAEILLDLVRHSLEGR